MLAFNCKVEFVNERECKHIGAAVEGGRRGEDCQIVHAQRKLNHKKYAGASFALAPVSTRKHSLDLRSMYSLQINLIMTYMVITHLTRQNPGKHDNNRNIPILFLSLIYNKNLGKSSSTLALNYC